jgi:capsular exopolysaccharide synthesis family protein
LSVRHFGWKPSKQTLLTLADRGVCVEQFRRLRSQIALLRDEFPIRTVLVSSGLPQEGKTFVAANLALSLARSSGNRVLLIDGDLRRPRLHDLFGAPVGPGLSEYLAGNADLTQILQRSATTTLSQSAEATLSNLTFVPAGRCGDNASELAAGPRFEELIKIVSSHFDWIVIDSAPVLVATDAVDLARAADGVLLVARAAITRFNDAQRTQAAFCKSRILGVVLNGMKNGPETGYYQYYGAETGGTTVGDRRG